MDRLQFAVCGAGFWSAYQLAAWRELNLADCIAVCDADPAKAQALAAKFGIAAVYGDAALMLQRERLDFVDIITSPPSHDALVRLAVEAKVPSICQKPMTETWPGCRDLVEFARAHNVWFAVHENWRWQGTLREVKRMLDRHEIGDCYRCRLSLPTGFDVFANQPTLRTAKQFIIADLACHFLDYARCLFGEADTIDALTHRTLPDVAGENVATLVLLMNGRRTTVTIELGYALTPFEHDCFPQTLALLEGTAGTIAVLPDYWIHCTTMAGTVRRRVPPADYAWAHPQYAVVHSSMVDCQRNLLESLQAGLPAETDAADNLKTMQLVFAAYEAAQGS